MASSYLTLPLRSEADARKDCERAVELQDIIAGRQPHCTHDHAATARAEQRRKVSALTHELRNAVEDREAESRPIDLQERADLIALKVLINEALA